MKQAKIYHIIYTHIIILAFVFSGISANAQTSAGGGTINPNFGKNFGSSQQKPGLLNKNNLHFSMQLGTSFSTSGFGTALTNFVSPSFTYKVNNKFSLQFGATVRNSFIDNRYAGETYFGTVQPFNGNVTHSTVWASGIYQPNERLILRGTVYKDFSMFSPVDPGNPFTNIDSHGAMLDVTFRPNSSFEIGVHMEYHRGYNPFRNPYGYGCGMGPYGRGGFGYGFGDPYPVGW
jgi:hypothetical protein